MLTIAIHQETSDPDPFAIRWHDLLLQQGVTPKWVNLMASDALEQVRDCNGVMWRFRHDTTQKQAAGRVLTCIEHYMGIPVFPNWATAWHYDEKITQSYLFSALGIPAPKNWVFWEKAEALKWAQQAEFPVVYKMSHGASSDNVTLVRNKVQATRLIELAFGPGVMRSDVAWMRAGGKTGKGLHVRWRRWAGRLVRETGDALRYNLGSPLGRVFHGAWGYAYFQEFIANNAFDTRITVIGDRAFAFRRLNREGDFRASGSGRLDYDQDAIDPRCIGIAFDATRRMGSQSCAFDFLMKDRTPLIGEISYTYVDKAIADCSGYWTPEGQFVEQPMWPQEAQLQDFLKVVRAAFPHGE